MKTKRISKHEINPVVRIANYHGVKQGSIFGPRMLPDFELILIVSGNFSYIECDSQKKKLLSEGEVISIQPGVLHVFKSEERNRPSAIACIHLEFYNKGTYLAKDYKLTTIPPLITNVMGDTAIHELFRNCRDTFEGFGKYRKEILNSMAKELYLRLLEYWENGSDMKISLRVRKMTAFLRENLDNSPTRMDLSKKFNISPTHVNALFKKELGISPTKFLNQCKIYQTCRLLREDGLSVKECAVRLGFYDEFHFSKTFKKVMGIPPSIFKGMSIH